MLYSVDTEEKRKEPTAKPVKQVDFGDNKSPALLRNQLLLQASKLCSLRTAGRISFNSTLPKPNTNPGWVPLPFAM